MLARTKWPIYEIELSEESIRKSSEERDDPKSGNNFDSPRKSRHSKLMEGVADSEIALY